jgi:hypothetical protein
MPDKTAKTGNRKPDVKLADEFAKFAGLEFFCSCYDKNGKVRKDWIVRLGGPIDINDDLLSEFKYLTGRIDKDGNPIKRKVGYL